MKVQRNKLEKYIFESIIDGLILFERENTLKWTKLTNSIYRDIMNESGAGEKGIFADDGDYRKGGTKGIARKYVFRPDYFKKFDLDAPGKCSTLEIKLMYEPVKSNKGKKGEQIGNKIELYGGEETLKKAANYVFDNPEKVFKDSANYKHLFITPDDIDTTPEEYFKKVKEWFHSLDMRSQYHIEDQFMTVSTFSTLIENLPGHNRERKEDFTASIFSRIVRSFEFYFFKEHKTTLQHELRHFYDYCFADFDYDKAMEDYTPPSEDYQEYVTHSSEVSAVTSEVTSLMKRMLDRMDEEYKEAYRDMSTDRQNNFKRMLIMNAIGESKIGDEGIDEYFSDKEKRKFKTEAFKNIEILINDWLDEGQG